MHIYNTELKDCGKTAPKELPIMKEIFCAKDKKSAVELAGSYLFGKYQDYAKWGQDKVMPENESFNQELEDLIKGRFILGSPEECYEELSALLGRIWNEPSHYSNTLGWNASQSLFG